MGAKIDPLPDREPLTLDRGLIGPAWYRWLFNLRSLFVNGTQQIGSTLVLTGQHAAISTTGIPLPGPLANGEYRVTSYLRVTAADGVSSSVQLTIGWTESGVTLTALAGAALTGDSITTVQGGTVPLVIDQNTAITYSTTYASNTPGQMQYKLTLLVESV